MGSLFSAIFSLGIVVPEHKIEEEAFKLAVDRVMVSGPEVRCHITWATHLCPL